MPLICTVVTALTARKWLGRYLTAGEAALADASSRPAHSPRAIDPAKALLIVELRRRRMLQSSIARSVGVSPSTVSRVRARAGLSKLSDLAPAEPVVRYEREAPGELLHIDTKKLGRIVRPSRQVFPCAESTAFVGGLGLVWYQCMGLQAGPQNGMSSSMSSNEAAGGAAWRVTPRTFAGGKLAACELGAAGGAVVCTPAPPRAAFSVSSTASPSLVACGLKGG